MRRMKGQVAWMHSERPSGTKMRHITSLLGVGFIWTTWRNLDMTRHKVTIMTTMTAELGRTQCRFQLELDSMRPQTLWTWRTPWAVEPCAYVFHTIIYVYFAANPLWMSDELRPSLCFRSNTGQPGHDMTIAWLSSIIFGKRDYTGCLKQGNDIAYMINHW